jgi:hypothetical protein
MYASHEIILDSDQCGPTKICSVDLRNIVKGERSGRALSASARSIAFFAAATALDFIPRIALDNHDASSMP